MDKRETEEFGERGDRAGACSQVSEFNAGGPFQGGVEIRLVASCYSNQR